MAFGFGILRHSSASFWALTPREIFAALQGYSGKPLPAPLSFSRAHLNDLMARYPDISHD